MNRPIRTLLLAAAIALALPATAPRAEPFTFQGHLAQSGTPIDGSADLAFKLYNAETGGAQLGSTISASGYPVADGVFTVDLDFSGIAFDGSARWLQVEVNGTPLSGRIEVLPAPVAASSNALRGRNVAGTAPTSGQVLEWSGSAWTPTTPSTGTTYSAGTGLALAGSSFSVAPTFRLPQGCSNDQIARWNGSSWVCGADANTTYSAGNGLSLSGTVFSVNFAGSGTADTVSRSDHGHFGANWSGSAAHGLTLETNDAFVPLRGFANATGTTQAVGVLGEAADSSEGIGVRGRGNRYGVQGQALTAAASGVHGVNNDSSGAGVGVLGESAGVAGIGVHGRALHANGVVSGVRGETSSSLGNGVQGNNTSTSGGSGVYGLSVAALGRGVLGVNQATTGDAAGVYGQTASGAGYGVIGYNAGATGSGAGVRGISGSDAGQGVYGEATSAGSSGLGVYGVSAGAGLFAGGVAGWATATSGSTVGVLGRSSSAEGAGVYGWASNSSGVNYGVIGVSNSPTGFAGYFSGNVHVNGNFTASGTKSFLIDHPLDPANRVLYHYNIESPEPFNLYRGTVRLDAFGAAEIELPEYFEAINADFSYQLTAVGAAMPNLHVAREVAGNRFLVAGGVSGKSVSWQVTAVRHDPWTRDRGFETEAEKPAHQKGYYLYPTGYGQDQSKAIGQETRKRAAGVRQ